MTVVVDPTESTSFDRSVPVRVRKNGQEYPGSGQEVSIGVTHVGFTSVSRSDPGRVHKGGKD